MDLTYVLLLGFGNLALCAAILSHIYVDHRREPHADSQHSYGNSVDFRDRDRTKGFAVK